MTAVLAPAVDMRPDARSPVPRTTHSAHVTRGRAYSFCLDGRGNPIELGSGRSAKAYLGEERWLDSKTDFRREVVIKVLQKGVSPEDRARFHIEKDLLERVQGHPNVIVLYASGEAENPDFLPPSLRHKLENDFVVLERLDLSLEDRLKGTRMREVRENLLAYDPRQRLLRVLDYMIPIASAVEYAHLVRNVCHRDIKPANVLLRVADPRLTGSRLEVRLADFNVARLDDEGERMLGMTQLASVPGTIFFQSPEQETNLIELLVNVERGSHEVEFFEDFYIQVARHDTFSLFNRSERYTVVAADRDRKRIVLDRPYAEPSESNVRARVQKSVGRAADIYALGALMYYLLSGAYGNPKSLYDAFHKFVEYDGPVEHNTVDAFLRHDYSIISSLRAPRPDAPQPMAPVDRFFSYRHYLDGNGELIDMHAMRIVCRCIIRNKRDSYCQAHEIDTRGISDVVRDLIGLYSTVEHHPTIGLQLSGRTTADRGPFGRKRWRAIAEWWRRLRSWASSRP